MPSEPRIVAAFCASCLVLAPSTARAQDQADQAPAPDDAARHRIDRTWLYVDDARVAAPMVVVATSNVSYTNVGSSPSRVASPYPSTYDGLAANTAQPGGMLGLGAEVGLIPRLSLSVLGQMGIGGVDGVPDPSAGALVGLRVDVTPAGWRSARLAVGGGYVREAWSGPIYDDDHGQWHPGAPNGDDGAWLQASVSVDVGRLRLATTVHAEHIFYAERDPVDVMAELGASCRVAGPLRLGVEYVGQDLEETFDDGAERGARHFIGPVASMQLAGDRLAIVAGPSLGLSSVSPQVLGRVGVSYGF